MYRNIQKLPRNFYDKKNPLHQTFIFILKYVFCKNLNNVALYLYHFVEFIVTKENQTSI